jgi:hypothetical protein
MAGTRRGLVVGMALFGLSGLTPAAAETVSLPGAAPQPKQGAPRPNQPATTAAAQPQNPLSDLASGLRSLFHLDTAAFTPAQRAQVDKTSAYLSSVQQMHGHFVQVAPDGSQSQGEFYVCERNLGPVRGALKNSRLVAILHQQSIGSSLGSLSQSGSRFRRCLPLIFIATTSEPRSLLSMARLNIADSHQTARPKSAPPKKLRQASMALLTARQGASFMLCTRVRADSGDPPKCNARTMA